METPKQDVLIWNPASVTPPAGAELLVEHVGGYRVMPRSHEDWDQWQELTLRWAALPERS